jgi:hypothetical protein
MRIAFTILVLSLAPLLSFGQNIKLLSSLKDSIQLNSQLMVQSDNDADKLLYSERITKNVEKLIKQEKSIEFNMDSLKLVKVLTSKNKYFRVFTWAIPLTDGTYLFKGISQSYVKSSKSYKISVFKDKGGRMSRAFNKELNSQKWYGAYYYKLIQTKRGKKYFYTLLGWRGIDKTVQSKIVEVATIRNNGDVVFGYNLFKIKGYEYFKSTPSVKRLIFKYSSLTNMYLSYDYQTILLKSKKKTKSKKKKSDNIGFVAQQRINQPKEKVKTIKDNMIVIDRLEPTSSDVKGFYEFYYPESNIIDALRFENNMWKYYPDIDARNETSPTDKKTKRIDYELTPE